MFLKIKHLCLMLACSLASSASAQDSSGGGAFSAVGPAFPGVGSSTDSHAAFEGGPSYSGPLVKSAASGPGSSALFSLYFHGRRRFLAGEAVDDSFLFLSSESELSKQVLSESILQVSGLPAGLRYEVDEKGLGYNLTGTALTPGVYYASVEWAPKGSPPITSTEFVIEVLRQDYAPVRRTVVDPALSRPLRQFKRYERGSSQTPVFYVEDDLGRRFVGAFSLVAEGLPRGLSVPNPLQGEVVGLVGVPEETGSFNLRVYAKFPDGSESGVSEYALEVFPPVGLPDLSGTYDCLVDRSEEVNASDGGRLTLTVGPTGAVSGFLLHQFQRLRFSSKNAALDLRSGDITIEWAGSGLVFRGVLEEDSYGYSSDNAPVFSLRGGLYSADGEEFARTVGLRVPVRPKTWVSAYASANPVNLVVAGGQLFSAPASWENGPSGVGFGSLRVWPSGMVTATVWPADGSSPVTAGARLSETEFMGAHMNLFFELRNSSGKSNMFGTVLLDSEGSAGGWMTWFQNASGRGAFPAGIPLRKYDGLIGARMTPAISGHNLTGFGLGDRNARLEFFSRSSEPLLSVPFRVGRWFISPAAVASPWSATPGAGSGESASNFGVRYNSRTGIFSGSLSLMNPATGAARPVQFRGMRVPGGNAVVGHFTVPGVDGGAELESGEIRLRSSE